MSTLYTLCSPFTLIHYLANMETFQVSTPHEAQTALSHLNLFRWGFSENAGKIVPRFFFPKGRPKKMFFGGNQPCQDCSIFFQHNIVECELISHFVINTITLYSRVDLQLFL